MYCKICGNLLNKDDKICKACGAEVVEETPSESIIPDAILEKEVPDVIFNPPYREGQKSLNTEDEEKKESRIGKPDTGEFSWDVYDFPKPAKSVPEIIEKPRFNWSSEEIEEASRVQKKARARAKADFRARTQPSIRTGSFSEPIPQTQPTQPVIPQPAPPEVTYAEQVMPVEQAIPMEQVVHEDPVQQQPSVPEMPQFQNFDALRYAPKEEVDEIITKSDLEEATAIEFQAKGIDTASANDKFFTFSKKNEEFQRLLDKEYARINGIEEPMAPAPPIIPPTPQEPHLTAPPPSQEVPAMREAVISPVKTVIPGPVEMNKQIHEIPFKHESENITSIEEKTKANEGFFVNPMEEEIVLDNDTIKQRYDTLEVLRNDLKGKTTEGEYIPQSPVMETPVVATIQPQIQPQTQPQAQPQTQAPVAKPETVVVEKFIETNDNKRIEENIGHTPLEAEITGIKQGDYSYFDHTEESEFEEEQKSGIAAKIVLVIIVSLLIAELTILGIKYFMPDSQATAFILDKEILIVETVSNWISKIKGIF